PVRDPDTGLSADALEQALVAEHGRDDALVRDEVAEPERPVWDQAGLAERHDRQENWPGGVAGDRLVAEVLTALQVGMPQNLAKHALSVAGVSRPLARHPAGDSLLALLQRGVYGQFISHRLAPCANFAAR